MNDADFEKWLETAQIRPLSPEEETKLRDWLAKNPQAQGPWEQEIHLNQLLDRLPEPPLASNFTAQVMHALDRENSRIQQPTTHRLGHTILAWFKPRLPKLAATFLVLGLGVISYVGYQKSQQEELAEGIQIAGTLSTLPTEALQDFEIINHLANVPSTPVDLDLLAALE